MKLRDDRDKSIPVEYRPFFTVKNVYTKILMVIKSEPSLFPKKHFNPSTIRNYLREYNRTDKHEKYLRKRWKFVNFDDFGTAYAVGSVFSQLEGKDKSELLIELANRGNDFWQELIYESQPTLWEADKFFKIREAYSNTASFRVCKLFPDLLFRNFGNEILGALRPVMVKYRFKNDARSSWTVRFSKLCDNPSELAKEFDLLTIDSGDAIWYEETEEVSEEAFDYAVFPYQTSLFSEVMHP